MSRGSRTREMREPGAGEVIAVLDKLVREKRLGTLVEVAKVVGLDEVSTEHSHRRLTEAFRSFEAVLCEIDRLDGQDELRAAVQEASPWLSPEEVDEHIEERFGTRV